MSDAAENIEPAAEPAAVEPTAIDPKAVLDRPGIEKFETWQDLEAGYRELETFRGNSVRIPSEEASAEDWGKFDAELQKVPGVVRLPEEGDTEAWQNFYQRVGAPADPSGYQFSEVEGYTGDRGDEGAFATLAHSLGLTRQQADGMHSWLAKNVSEREADSIGEIKSEIDRLRGEWGSAYDHKFQAAKNAARVFDSKVPGIADYFKNLDPNGMYDPNLVRLMSEVSGLIGESGAHDMQRTATMTPEEAKLQIQEIRSNPDHPYNNDLDPAHEAAKKKVVDLYKLVAPG